MADTNLRHLLNDGVEESPPSPCPQKGGSSQELFTNLEGANVGFKHWHPVAITAFGNKLAGQSDMGGVWEWTSSALEKHDGFEPMPLYPAYTGTLLFLLREEVVKCGKMLILKQPISLTESTTSSLEAHGQRIQELRGARHCKSFSFQQNILD